MKTLAYWKSRLIDVQELASRNRSIEFERAVTFARRKVQELESIAFGKVKGQDRKMERTKGKLTRGCVVFMKASSGLVGYGNAQCISDVHGPELGTISLYGHNKHYKTYDIDKIVEYPIDKDSHAAPLKAC